MLRKQKGESVIRAHLTEHWTRVKQNIEQGFVGEVAQLWNRIECDRFEFLIDAGRFGVQCVPP